MAVQRGSSASEEDSRSSSTVSSSLDWSVGAGVGMLSGSSATCSTSLLGEFSSREVGSCKALVVAAEDVVVAVDVSGSRVRAGVGGEVEGKVEEEEGEDEEQE